MSSIKDELIGRDIYDLNEQLCGPSKCDFGFEWRQIPWASKYFVSSSGEVASTVHGYLHELKTWPNQYGHQYVGIVDDCGNQRKMSVHRLVAELFVHNDDPTTNSIVRHLDDDPMNNYSENLAWGTQADNHRDCVEHGREYTRPVYCYETGKEYRSCADAANELGVSKSLITACCQGKVHAVKGGYHFCYLSDKNEKEARLDEWISKNGNFKPVIAINVDSGEELYFKSRKEASELTGVIDSSISSILAGRFKKSGCWTFVEASGR